MDNILKNNEMEKSGIPTDDSKVAPEDLDMRWIRWKCLVCGYVYEGVNPLRECPKCGNNDADKFEEVE